MIDYDTQGALYRHLLDGASYELAARLVGLPAGRIFDLMDCDAELRANLANARECGKRLKGKPLRRPQVGWSKVCPQCGGGVEVRLAGKMPRRFRFWRCGRWPECSFRSWRPRAVYDCPACGGARFWSLSRKSIGCPGCGEREFLDAPRVELSAAG